MKTIGMVGGTGWMSTVEYYTLINEETNRRLGGLEFARCILFSINYGEIDTCNKNNNSAGVLSLVRDAALKLEASEAGCIVLCANTLHQFVGDLEPLLNVPIIDITRATATQVKRSNITRVGLLGTSQTMEMSFFKSRLSESGCTVLVPGSCDRNFIQEALSDEILKGFLTVPSRNRLVSICNELIYQGAGGIILGCTELPLFLKQSDISVPLFDTLTIHALAAVDFALS